MDQRGAAGMTKIEQVARALCRHVLRPGIAVPEADVEGRREWPKTT